MTFEIVLLFVMAAMILVILVLFILLLREFTQQETREPKQQPSSRRYLISKRTQPIKVPVNRATQDQLLLLLHGDRGAALRLVERERGRNPQRHEQWLWEKVIGDLERDRRI